MCVQFCLRGLPRSEVIEKSNCVRLIVAHRVYTFKPYFDFFVGEVILDKINAVKTVVNKVNIIDNTYRNFQMELLAGEHNFITSVKEHGVVYEFDFSRVYWNPRLGIVLFL